MRHANQRGLNAETRTGQDNRSKSEESLPHFPVLQYCQPPIESQMVVKTPFERGGAAGRHDRSCGDEPKPNVEAIAWLDKAFGAASSDPEQRIRFEAGSSEGDRKSVV